jgi:hypothetical protein
LSFRFFLPRVGDQKPNEPNGLGKPPEAMRGRDLPFEQTRPVLVLTDLRTEPFLTILHLALARPRPRLLISEASLRQGDFGDRIGPIARWLRVSLLRLVSPVEVVRTSGGPLSHDSCLGCMSSLVSFTIDEDASPAEYPEIWDRLNVLCEGAHAVAQQLEEGVEEVCVFNGRVASVRPISRLNRLGEHPKVYVYEWGPRGGTYFLDSYPLHDPDKMSREMLAFALQTNFDFSVEVAKKFRSRKLNSPFSIGRNAQPRKTYRTVIFSGSQHEYRWALDNRDYLDADFPKLLRAAVTHPSFSRPAAIKLHPNSSSSKYSKRNENRVRELCSELDIDLIESTSPVNHVDLIKGANTVMVSASTVGFDAFLLGHEPVFLGPNAYRGLIEAVVDRFGTGEASGLRVAGIAGAYFASKVHTLRPGLKFCGETYRKWLKWYRSRRVAQV